MMYKKGMTHEEVKALAKVREEEYIYDEACDCYEVDDELAIYMGEDGKVEMICRLALV